jgi:phosphate acetyltransferase
MNVSLHTDGLMGAGASRQTGIRTARRLSHCLIIASPVAGRAVLFVVPDLEAGNMRAKSLSFPANADAVGVVLGARVPNIPTSRADSSLTSLASRAAAVMVAAARRCSTSVSIL